MEYPVRDFSRVRGLKKLPDGLIEAHLKLYAGYVTNANLLTQKLAQLKPGALEWSEMKRRFGFELNGIRLHEYYFEALSAGGGTPSESVSDVLGKEWGSFDRWREEFTQMGKMRGIGWVITYRDPSNGSLSNHWVELHHNGHPAGFTPVVVMDVWEHAYTGLERPAYIDAYMASLDWSVIEKRLAPRK